MTTILSMLIVTRLLAKRLGRGNFEKNDVGEK